MVVQFTGSWTELLNTDSVLTLLNKQFLLRENSNSNVIDSTLSYIGTNNVNQNSLNSVNGNGNGNGNGNKAGVPKSPKLSVNTKNSWNLNSPIDSSELNLENRNYPKDASTSNPVSSNINNVNRNNGNGINKNKISPSTSSDSYDRSGNSKKGSIREETPWSPLVKISKNKNIDQPSGSSTTFLNNITKKATKVDNSTKRNSSLTQSAFTSYLQELMDFDE